MIQLMMFPVWRIAFVIVELDWSCLISESLACAVCRRKRLQQELEALASLPEVAAPELPGGVRPAEDTLALRMLAHVERTSTQSHFQTQLDTSGRLCERSLTVNHACASLQVICTSVRRRATRSSRRTWLRRSKLRMRSVNLMYLYEDSSIENGNSSL